MNEQILTETAGWLGVVFYVFSYFLLSTGRLKSNSYIFHILNALGAIGLIIVSTHEKDKPNIAVNVIWLGIGIYAIAKRFRGRSNQE
ncbi:MAG TPA: hypothetical protein VGN64_10875 [Dyadobacter sp.]|jgi:hypothetical protein|nr:hypothetical protein [Dyadobacter sp.]